jgi:Integrase core domain
MSPLQRRIRLTGHTLTKIYLSTDNDPLYRFHQWQANLRVLEVMEIKTVPYVPLSHPFVERLIGTLRRECLDRTLFWTTTDLEAKLLDFQHYYNEHRTYAGRKGHPPVPGVNSDLSRANLSCCRWQKHCRGEWNYHVFVTSIDVLTAIVRSHSRKTLPRAPEFGRAVSHEQHLRLEPASRGT